MAEQKQSEKSGRQNRIWSASSKFFHSRTCPAAARIAKKNVKSGTAPSNKVAHSCISNSDNESVLNDELTETAETKASSMNVKLLSQSESQASNPVSSQSLSREHISSRPIIESGHNNHNHAKTQNAPEKELHLNPHCQCDPCNCTPPCTCGLQKRESKTHTQWDADNHMLTHTVSDIYRPAPRNHTPAIEPSQPSTTHHNQPINTDTTRVKTADEALGQLTSTTLKKHHFLEKYQQADAFSGHHDANAVSVRTANHKGYNIEIRTHYEISIDGEELDLHIQVSPEGKVHCHSIPNYESGSTVELIQTIVDNFRDDFPPKT